MLNLEGTRVNVPHEDDQWFELRPLSWRQLKKARREAGIEQRENLKALGAELVKSIFAADEGKIEAAQTELEKRKYDISNYDMGVLLRYGIVGWSYTEKVTEEDIDNLDERTAIWASKEILEMSRPPSEEEIKNS